MKVGTICAFQILISQGYFSKLSIIKDFFVKSKGYRNLIAISQRFGKIVCSGSLMINVHVIVLRTLEVTFDT